MTSGRLSATASATARDPSICLSTDWLLDECGSSFGCGDVAVGELAREAVADRGGHRLDGDHAREGGEAAEQDRVRKRAPEMLTRELGCGNREHALEVEAVAEVLEPQLRERSPAVDQDVCIPAGAVEDVDLVQQRRVLDDQAVWLGDRLSRANRLVIDAAERDDRRAGA